MKTVSSLIFLAVGALGLLLASGCAAPQHSPASRTGKSCFYASQVNNFALVNRNTVNFRVGVSDIYEARLLGNCGDIAWTESIAFDAGATSLVCSGLGATLIVPTAIGPRRCPVNAIRKLTPAEVSALPRGTKP